jgi:hypothetical protein
MGLAHPTRVLISSTARGVLSGPLILVIGLGSLDAADSILTTGGGLTRSVGTTGVDEPIASSTSDAQSNGAGVCHVTASLVIWVVVGAFPVSPFLSFLTLLALSSPVIWTAVDATSLLNELVVVLGNVRMGLDGVVGLLAGVGVGWLLARGGGSLDALTRSFAVRSPLAMGVRELFALGLALAMGVRGLLVLGDKVRTSFVLPCTTFLTSRTLFFAAV